MQRRWAIITICFVACLLVSTFGDIDIAQCRVIKLAFIVPVTGANAAQGIGMTNSFDLAIREANKSGKFPYKIELMGLDDASDPAVAFSAALKAVSDKRVVAGSGHWNSGCALATIHAFHSNKIPFIVCGAVSPRITEYNYPEITRNCPMVSQESIPLANWLIKDLGYKTFSVMADTSDYGQQGLRDWEKLVQKHRARIVSVDSFPAGTTDFRPILTKIKDLNPDVIYLSGVVTEGALIRNQMVKLGLTMVFASISGLSDEKYNQVAGNAAEGTLITGPGFDWENLPGGPEFKKAYQAQGYKEPMGAYGIYAYEAAKIILEALKQVGPDDKVALAKAIRSMKYKGILGTTTFDGNGQTELALATKLVSQDGKWVEWEKSKYASGQLKLPKPKE